MGMRVAIRYQSRGGHVKEMAEYVSEGWTPAPVCTPTFKLLLRGHDLAAILAEDLPGGTTVTELLRKGVL